MKNARQKAFEILSDVHNNKTYSNISIDSAIESEEMDSRDSSLLSALVYGTLERIITLDYNIALYLKKPINKLRPEILTILRLGAFQIFYMDKIPVSAAVNECANIIKKTRYSFATGLVNAVLRKIAENGLVLPSDYNSPGSLSIKYSCPEWLVSLWIESYGLVRTLQILEYSQIKPPAYIRVNRLITTSDNLLKLFKDEGINAKIHYKYEHVMIIEKNGSVERFDSFKSGLFHYQDISSQLFCRALNAKPGDIIFDLCAAPGGKSFTLAQDVEKKGKVYAFDIHENRLELIRNSAVRLKIENVIINNGDACVFNQRLGYADIVICDVPCSGFGVIRRKPEIRYKIADNIDKLPELQYFILCNASNYVKLGGLLAYSTCTLNPSENEQVCLRFLADHSDCFSVEINSEACSAAQGSMFTTLFPNENNSDGFFFALFRRMR